MYMKTYKDIFVPKNKRDIINVLKKQPKDHLDYYLLDFVFEGNIELVKLLLEIGADINISDTYDNFNYTPLMWAIASNHNNIIKLLIDKGADVNKTGKYNETPLMKAVRMKNTYAVKLLLKNGANINLKNSFNNSALDLVSVISASKQKQDIIQLFKDANSSKF